MENYGALAALQDANLTCGSGRWKCSGRLRSPRTIPMIVALVRDPHDLVRAAAARALGAMGPAAKDQIPHLATCSKTRIALSVLKRLAH